MAAIQRVLVTGAAGALGSRVCARFSEAGLTVIAADLPQAVPAESTEIHADADDKNLHWIGLDLREPAAVRDGVDAIEKNIGAIDALVHCAGGFRWALMGEVSDDDIDFLLDANLRSSLLLLREILPKMKAQNLGRIVLMSSKSTLNPQQGEGPYAATKAALNALTKSVADEVKALDVTINALLPTVIDTPANRDAMPDSDFDKWVTRDQLADIIFGLTQPTGAPINGALIPVSGKM
ncbi:SDR family NAD(P)-dependent oxidoreductase [Bradymonas sediminis]|uniref:NAD-dependent oxidoreductase n=1 Tax=Bradymonas sediminis TaxID=1548548 RepID=A0A2Z4FIQ7_9DELT|nr:SDR family NAD(P)-dependent oxidoreductase [Bradymonas sediminis]AWV88832.1 NAD-dependent oxidoreductase [Bradymonas sediminis]TDP71834.1 NAD(P)-dependent dehydrogenase (short-subunit alcohol dehydrogenase family) [Bradymonas sediminis]